jgi:hypothetical protein
MFLGLLVWGGVIHMELLSDNSNQIRTKSSLRSDFIDRDSGGMED